MQPITLALLAGPYIPPQLRRGERTFCLMRDRYVKIVGIHDARIPWPTCVSIDYPGRPGLLVTEELLRAARTESAKALMHWFGVTCTVVWKWRKAAGVRGKFGTAGSRQLHAAASELGAAEVRGKKLVLTEEQRAERSLWTTIVNRRLLRERGCLNPKQKPWTKAERRLLGKMPDREVAARTGRSERSVRWKRRKLKIGPFTSRPWTAAEDAVVLSMRPRFAAKELGRTVVAVNNRKRKLRRAAASGG